MESPNAMKEAILQQCLQAPTTRLNLCNTLDIRFGDFSKIVAELKQDDVIKESYTPAGHAHSPAIHYTITNKGRDWLEAAALK